MTKFMFIIVILIMVFTGFIIKPAGETKQITLTILYDNYVFKEGTKSDWGFACFIEGTEKTILFDTGTKGQILLHNANNLGIDLNNLDLIVISHNHGDHTGGIDSVLKIKSGIPVYIGSSFPVSFSQYIKKKGAIPVKVEDPVEICRHVYSTGELNGPVNEQSLILDTDDGLVIITGCSHPGIVNIVQRAKQLHKKNIYLVFGGFHLMRHSDIDVGKIIQEFKSLGVEKCGATHCTGDRAIKLIQQAFGADYLPMGTGQVIKVKTLVH
jgi:7,8-dihydropterin-6-yl-methyl-4-(beta-D-ribofuranosyl)aminobenzene 5'-phosphate synthase